MHHLQFDEPTFITVCRLYRIISSYPVIHKQQDKVRLLQEDLDGERELRQRIEREKSDLMVQLMQLSERLDDAEGSSESKAEMNKKRDAELAKLRKLLEDVHLESEENAHQLRTKHQAAVAEMQDQVDQLQKQKSK